MKQLSKHLIIIFSLILFFSSLSIGQTKWAPIVMNDIIIFVPYKKSIVPPVDTSIVLSSAQAQTNIADKGTYVHYKIYAHTGDQVKIDLYDMDANGNLYVKMGSSASINSNDCKSENGSQTHSTQSESCTITANSDGYIYMAVYAPSYGCYTNVEHTIKATIGDIAYGEFGDYDTDTWSNSYFLAVYPKLKEDITPTTPVIFFIPGVGNNITNYEPIMTFIASHGFMVIGAKTNNTTYNDVISDLEDGLRIARQDHGLTADKFMVIGHSIGGGTANVVMHHFQHINNPCGRQGSVTLSVEGVFPRGLYENQIKSIEGKSFFLFMNNSKNMGGEDSRSILTTWGLRGASTKGLLTFSGKEHGYISGNVDDKSDLRLLIGALLYDLVHGNESGYNAIPTSQKTNYDTVLQNTQSIDSYSGWKSCHYYDDDNIIGNIQFCKPELYK